jgi:AAA domain-containing protein/helix-turn-helix protein
MSMPREIASELSKIGATRHRVARNTAVRAVRTVRGVEHPEHPEHSNGLFTSKSMNQCLKEASERPAPTQLCDAFWQDGELALFFGSTGDGKTVFGMQLANDIANGRTSTGLANGNDPCLVNYFDFELSDAQHLSRYSEGGRNIFKFSDNLNRIEMDLGTSGRASDLDANWEQTLLAEIERKILESKAKASFFDNLTWLSRETDKGRFALPLMQRLCAIKKQHNHPMLVMAHTPKRDETRPIGLNDLAGSRILANFADSIFAIGKSARDPGIRYLKQIKARSSEIVYSTENVATFNFGKTGNFLGFQFTGEQSEREHLRAMDDGEYAERTREAKELSAQGCSQREISRKLGISVSTVNKYIRSPNAPNGESEREHPRTPANGYSEEIFFPASGDGPEIAAEREAIEWEGARL